MKNKAQLLQLSGRSVSVSLSLFNPSAHISICSTGGMRQHAMMCCCCICC
ncbi:MAG: hypothetical protein N2044_06650 [Cyclobacteriaceae bacterium]|nr:hypothetical protein [Cyclobacteriaceae bacterium]MCX7637507.1 hypothetical protein [Cyclobacteriaceae bacterium]MDW8332024.1 hypothetical protein [Cyclobacteriaceae bacterium]